MIITTRPSASHWQTVINSLDDELAIMDRDFRFVDVNEVVLTRYNLTRDDVIGKFCFELVHHLSAPCNSPGCVCPILRVIETGKPARETHIHNYGVKLSGYSDVVASPIRDDSGEIVQFAVLIRDVSELKRLQHETAESNRQLVFLNDIASAAARSLDLDTILGMALDKTLAAVGCNSGYIFLYDERTQSLHPGIHRGFSERFIKTLDGLKSGQGMPGKAVATRKIVLDQNASADDHICEVARNEGIRSLAVLPLISNDKVQGVISVCTRGDALLQPRDISLLDSVSKQIAIAIENARLHAQLQTKEESHRDLLRQIISIQEAERQRVSRELHDEISQSITGLAFNLEVIAELIPSGNSELKERLKTVQRLSGKMLDDIHGVIHDLRPALLDDLGLAAAIQALTDTYNRESGLQLLFETLGTERPLNAEAEIALFRIAQEAVTNIIRHAGGESASICLEYKDTSVVLHIEDDGRGFDPDIALNSGGTKRGFGLLGMRERAELMGGTLNIDSSQGAGTRIRAEIPG